GEHRLLIDADHHTRCKQSAATRTDWLRSVANHRQDRADHNRGAEPCALQSQRARVCVKCCAAGPKSEPRTEALQGVLESLDVPGLHAAHLRGGHVLGWIFRHTELPMTEAKIYVPKTEAKSAARTYNQIHHARKFTPGRRRVSIYVCWSFPG